MGVIGAHVSLIYALDVGWYYEERTAGEGTKALLAGIFRPALVFGMGLLFFVTDEVRGLNVWEYPQMMTLFVLGALATERRWLADGLSLPLRRACGWAAAVGIALIAALGVAITLSDDPDPFLGGFRLEATIIPAAEAMIAVGMSLWAVDWFRRRWDRSGPVSRAMGRASFSAYLVHAPLTVILAIAIRDVDIAAEAKLLAVFMAATIASYWLGWLFTRSDKSGRVL